MEDVRVVTGAIGLRSGVSLTHSDSLAIDEGHEAPENDYGHYDEED